MLAHCKLTPYQRSFSAVSTLVNAGIGSCLAMQHIALAQNLAQCLRHQCPESYCLVACFTSIKISTVNIVIKLIFTTITTILVIIVVI